MPELQDGSLAAGIAAIVHRRGIAPASPGLAFLGMRYQYRVGSALLGGVGEDAARVVSQTVKFLHAAGRC